MITYAAEAVADVDGLAEHYDKLGRPEAIVNLHTALSAAASRIGSDPACGANAPRPYRELARPGRWWVKSGRYWIVYAREPQLAILGVYHDTADIPRRIRD